MTTMNVLDAGGGIVAVEKPLPPSRSAAATSRPVALSTEDKAALDLVSSTIAAATPAAAGGIASTARLASAANSTNATNVKTTTGRVFAVQGINKAAYDVFLVLYDSPLVPPVPGTTAIRKKIPLAANATFSIDWPVGLSFPTGIGFAFTKLAADADTTVLVAGDILQFNLDYA